ncbi:MAG: phosphatidylglycerophosphate synthase [Pirellulaceae bacterium]|nr:MAG: phosphatidylglycerophosphate synthase [Pirellulaceae bacterium]
MDSTPQTHSRVVTVPNVLSGFRLVGSLLLVPFAWLGWETAFLVLVIAVIISDWVDGKLAIWLRQQSPWGARLDSVADVTMYAAILVSMLWLRWPVIWAESAWIVAAVISYGVMGTVGWWKFGVWPSYHTRAAKTCWFLTSVAVMVTLADGPAWCLRAAMAAVVLTNLEMILITHVISRPRTDLPTVYHAWKIERAEAADERERVGAPR